MFRSWSKGSGSRRVVATLLTLVLTATIVPVAAFPSIAAAGTPSTLPFPRVGVWWPESDVQPAADRARYDWIELQNRDAHHIAELRALNPDMIIMGAINGRELNYDERDYNAAVNVELRTASLRWVVTQVGSTLTASVDGATTTLPVADVTKFRTGDAVVIDEELVLVKTVGTSSLTVQRGVGKPAASHAGGTRLAAAASAWTRALEFDVSANCPAVDVGFGPETWNQWNARRALTTVKSAAWSGLTIDCYDANPSYWVTSGMVRSLDPKHQNVAIDLATYDAQWNAGMVAAGDAMRAAVGPDVILLGNSGVKNYNLNGRNYETFPKSTTALDIWNAVVIGPWGYSMNESYLDWVKYGAQPNLSTIQTYEYDDRPPSGWQTNFTPNYQKMRYGLTTALMADGFFAYEISTYGHGTLGLYWFDEFDNAGKQRGYLGQPTGAATAVGSNVWRRDYQGGIALVNPDTVAHTISLGGSFRKIKGTQAPSVNDGSLVTAVTLQPRDGIVLLRENVVVTPPVTPPPTTPTDSTPPISNLLSGSAAPKRWNAGSVSLSLDATDSGTGVESAYVDRGAGTEAVQPVFSFSLSGEGDKSVKYWAKDKAGNVEAVHTAQIGIDLSAPSVSSDAKSTAYIGSAVINISATDALSGVSQVEYKVDGGTAVSGNAITLVPTVFPASYQISFRASDAVGNWSAWSAAKTVTVEKATHVGLYRFFNVQNGTHFYTASAAERDATIANLSSIYKYEGIAMYVSDNPAEGVPVYRFYSGKYGAHFYTASAAERDNIIATLSNVYSYEGTAFYAAASSVGSMPVFRFYNTKTHTHFYTASAAERDSVRTVLGKTYHFEGTSFYAWSN